SSAAASSAPAASAASSAAASASGSAKPLVKVIMLGSTFTPVTSLAPQVSIPVLLNYWKDEGLDVMVKNGVENDAASMQLLATGQATIAVYNPVSLMNAREKGLPLQAVYEYVRQANNSIYVLDSSPIKSITELKGKVLGLYNLSGDPVNEAKYILKTAG